MSDKETEINIDNYSLQERIEKLQGQLIDCLKASVSKEEFKKGILELKGRIVDTSQLSARVDLVLGVQTQIDELRKWMDLPCRCELVLSEFFDLMFKHYSSEVDKSWGFWREMFGALKRKISGEKAHSLKIGLQNVGKHAVKGGDVGSNPTENSKPETHKHKWKFSQKFNDQDENEIYVFRCKCGLETQTEYPNQDQFFGTKRPKPKPENCSYYFKEYCVPCRSPNNFSECVLVKIGNQKIFDNWKPEMANIEQIIEIYDNGHESVFYPDTHLLVRKEVLIEISGRLEVMRVHLKNMPQAHWTHTDHRIEKLEEFMREEHLYFSEEEKDADSG